MSTIRMLAEDYGRANVNGVEFLSPVTYASMSGNVDALRTLVRAGADPRSDADCALRWAALTGATDTVEALISEFGADVHCGGEAPLRWAADGGHLGVVQLLLRRFGADPRAEGHAALKWAACSGHGEVVRELLSWSCLPERSGNRGRRDPCFSADFAKARQALGRAVMLGRFEVVRAVFEALRDPGESRVPVSRKAYAKLANGALRLATAFDRVRIVAFLTAKIVAALPERRRLNLPPPPRRACRTWSSIVDESLRKAGDGYVCPAVVASASSSPLSLPSTRVRRLLSHWIEQIRSRERIPR